jgi:hypothetical protein
MSFNKLERKALKQIALNEGVVSKIAAFFLGKKFRSTMSELERMKKDDPSLAADLASFEQSYKIIQQAVDNICKRRPDHPACKK